MLFVFNSKFERVFKLKQYSANRIKNIAIVGHGGKGKTSLCEAMLYVSGATDRLGKVSDGNTVMDFDPEEKNAPRRFRPPSLLSNGRTASLT